MTDTQLDFKAIFQSYMDTNVKTWAHDRNKSVGASEVFACIRQVWFRKRGAELGYEQDDDFEQSWGATERGNLLENHFVVPAVRDHLPDTAKLLMSGSQQQTLHKGKNSATPDGLIVGLAKDALAQYGVPDIESDCIMLEIKSVDPRVKLTDAKTIHKGQTQVQMGIIRSETKYRPMYAVIVYVDASFLDNIRVFVVKFEEKMWLVAQDRAATIFEIDTPEELMAEGKLENGCEYCEFQTACALVTTGSIPGDNAKAVQEHERAVMREAVEDFKAKQDAAKEAAYEMEAAKVQIKELLKTLHTRKVNDPKKWSVSWSARKGKKSLDTARLKEDIGMDDLDNYMKEGDPFDVLTVKFVE